MFAQILNTTYTFNMIKKMGNAFKKMAQRSLWRGDRASAQAISDHGMYGMRANNKQISTAEARGTNSSSTGSKVILNQSIEKNNTSTAVSKEDKQNSKGLGGSILNVFK